METNNKNLPEVKVLLFFLIIGVVIGFRIGYKEEEPPYKVWLDRDASICVVQEAGHDVYVFGMNNDGSCDLSYILGRDAPTYPSQARPPIKLKRR